MACVYTVYALILTSILPWSALFVHTVITAEAQSFQVVPSNTCVPCGGPTVLNCATTAAHPIGGGRVVAGVGGQLWRIQSPSGTVTTLSSSMPNDLPPGYALISPHLDEYTGLLLLDTSSDWNGTTFQCIAFTPVNEEEQNNSAPAVTLEVGGPPCMFSCRCRCPDLSDRCNIIWERLPTVSCSSLQVSVSLRQPDETLVYSDVFSPSVTSIETAPLNQNTVYTVTIAAENVCGNTTCSANCSMVLINEPAAFIVSTKAVSQSSAQNLINVTWTPPRLGDPLVDSYTVNVSSTDGQQLCGSQTTAGNATSVVLDVTGCVMCQGSNKSYDITVEASNRGGQTTALTSLTTGPIQTYQVQDVSAGGQCELSISCTVSDRTVATGCVFMYDSTGDGTLDSETLMILPTIGNTAEHRLNINCNLNRLNFTLSAIVGTTFFATMPLDCPVSSSSFDHVSSRVCSALQNPQNGHVDYNNQQRTVGTTATYSCNSEFVINGNEERQCQIDATWSGLVPTCTNPKAEFPEPEDQEPAIAGLSAGVVVGISITIFLVSFFAGALLATLITYCCCVKGRGKSSGQPHLSPSENPLPVPVYAEVIRTRKLEMKKNPAYEVGAGKVEMKQNPSYGPVGH